MQNKRSLGSEKEQQALDYLTEHNVKILDKNYYFRGGEIDLIVQDGEYVCFIEVKYRKSNNFGAPEEAVTLSKQKKIIQGAKVYLYLNRYPTDTPCRFDVISVSGQEIKWIKDAFAVAGW